MNLKDAIKALPPSTKEVLELLGKYPNEHIKNAEGMRCYLCPLARHLSKVCNEDKISVGTVDAFLYRGDRIIQERLPIHVQHAIRTLDTMAGFTLVDA